MSGWAFETATFGRTPCPARTLNATRFLKARSWFGAVVEYLLAGRFCEVTFVQLSASKWLVGSDVHNSTINVSLYDGAVTLRKSRRSGLARVLSKRGFCSRSQAVALIQSRRVTVNGSVRRNSESSVDPQHDRICVDGLEVRRSEPLYWAINKPRGVVTTASDERGRQTVLDLLPGDTPWIAPVGRLDKASEGLLLLTNDSEWGARILDPASHLDKIYHVQVRVKPDAELFRILQTGVRVDEGTHLRVKSAAVIRQGKTNAWLEICLDEGKNRHIRRIFEALEIEVLRLVRVAIGPVQLGTLPKGAARPMSAEELQSLAKAMFGDVSAGAQTPRKYVPK